jgi:hypothetical protein
MTTSWGNFFFASFDPGGFISVDKPPGGAVGVGDLGSRVRRVELEPAAPGVLAGAATVALLWCIVRRWFGVAASIVAASPCGEPGQRGRGPAEPPRAVPDPGPRRGGVGAAPVRERAPDAVGRPPAASSGWRSTRRCSPCHPGAGALGLALLLGLPGGGPDRPGRRVRLRRTRHRGVVDGRRRPRPGGQPPSRRR